MNVFLGFVCMASGVALVAVAPLASAALWYGGWLWLVSCGRWVAVAAGAGVLACAWQVLSRNPQDYLAAVEAAAAVLTIGYHLIPAASEPSERGWE